MSRDYFTLMSNFSFKLSWINKKDRKLTEVIDIPSDLSPEEFAEQVPILLGRGFDTLQQIKKKLDQAYKDADLACEVAIKADNQSVGFFTRTTPAIEALQQTAICQCKAQLCLCECQQLMFDQQQILAACSKLLFLFCTANLANARIAIKEITMRLEGASEEQISEVARQEMGRIVEQLKMQIDIFEKQERLQNKVKDLEGKVNALADQNNKFSNMEEKVTALTNELKMRRIFYAFIAIFLGVIGIMAYMMGKFVKIF